MLPVSGFNRALNEVAPALSRRFFSCSSRVPSGLRSDAQAPRKIHGLGQPVSTTKSCLGIRRYGTNRSTTLRSDFTRGPTSNRSSLLRSKQNANAQPKFLRTFATSLRSRSAATTTTADAIADAAKSEAGKGSSFPKTSTNTVAYWLLGSAASVFGIVVFGGLTRLTESG